MKQKTLLALSVVWALVCGCVYPFDNPVPDSQYNGIVIEGDLLIGGICEISLGRLLPLSEEIPDSLLAPVKAEVRAENDLGDIFEAGSSSSDGTYVIDLTDAPSDGQYRLKVTTEDGAVYYSEYAAAKGSCTIDALDYTVYGNLVKLSLDVHSDDSARHFRYSYHETWEYHSQVFSRLDYSPASISYPYGQILPGNTNYYCWKRAYSRGINLFTTETMDEDRLEDYPILALSRTNQRFSIWYRMDLDVYPVDSNSYRYYEHLKEVSTFTGSLFSPVPSEMKGNITCENDPSRTAYGYIAVVKPTRKRIEIRPEDVDYYNPDPQEVSFKYSHDEKQWPSFYRSGFLPVEDDPMMGIAWAEARCVDCRRSGGTKDKPADWPTDHL